MGRHQSVQKTVPKKTKPLQNWSHFSLNIRRVIELKSVRDISIKKWDSILNHLQTGIKPKQHRLGWKPTPSLKLDLLEKQEGLCPGLVIGRGIQGWTFRPCGINLMNQKVKKEVDHCEELRYGGSNNVENLQYLCYDNCHREKTQLNNNSERQGEYQCAF